MSKMLRPLCPMCPTTPIALPSLLLARAPTAIATARGLFVPLARDNILRKLRALCSILRVQQFSAKSVFPRTTVFSPSEYNRQAESGLPVPSAPRAPALFSSGAADAFPRPGQCDRNAFCPPGGRTDLAALGSASWSDPDSACSELPVSQSIGDIGSNLWMSSETPKFQLS